MVFIFLSDNLPSGLSHAIMHVAAYDCGRTVVVIGREGCVGTRKYGSTINKFSLYTDGAEAQNEGELRRPYGKTYCSSGCEKESVSFGGICYSKWMCHSEKDLP